MSYIAGSGASKSKVDELCMLANSYDDTGSYTSQEHGITYRKLVKTDVVGVTYKIFETDLTGNDLKTFMSKNSTDGYEFFETNFEDLENLLAENAIYSCFQFKDGVHNKENLFGGTKFAVIDVDKSVLTDKEAHVLLEEYNHFIARTSNPDNEFKFRIILELDAVVTVDARTWKAFIQEIAEELGLIADPIPQSQIILSYADRDILKQLEGRPLNAKMFIDRAALRIKDRPKPPNTLPSKEKETKLADPRTTFAFAFECLPGERSNKIFRALAYAIDLGADEEYVKQLAEEINNYLTDSMDQHRLNRTLVQPALRRLKGI